jgi:hypothetical protein
MAYLRGRTPVAALFLSCAAIATPCWAQSADGASAATAPQQDPEKEAMLARIQSLEQKVAALQELLGDTATVSDADKANMRGRGLQGTPSPTPTPAPSPDSAATSADASQDTASVASADGDRKTPAPSDAVQTVSEREQGYFGQRLSIELGETYSHFDDARVNLSGFLALDAIFLGLISIDETQADVLTTDFTARYGVTDRLQFDVNVPYLLRRAYYKSGGAGGNANGLIETTTWDSGLGDVSAGFSYRMSAETLTLPDIVANVRIKAPTGRDPFGIELVDVTGSQGNLKIPQQLSFGTGLWAASAGFSVLKSLDPMVVFGSVNYFHNFRKSFGDIDEAPGDQPGRVDIGDAFQYGAGVAFALNERSSLSTSFTQRFVRATWLRSTTGNWQKIIGSMANVALLNFGATFGLTDKVALLGNVSVGMTRDAPNMVVSLMLPIRF